MHTPASGVTWQIHTVIMDPTCAGLFHHKHILSFTGFQVELFHNNITGFKSSRSPKQIRSVPSSWRQTKPPMKLQDDGVWSRKDGEALNSVEIKMTQLRHSGRVSAVLEQEGQLSEKCPWVQLRHWREVHSSLAERVGCHNIISSSPKRISWRSVELNTKHRPFCDPV